MKCFNSVLFQLKSIFLLLAIFIYLRVWCWWNYARLNSPEGQLPKSSQSDCSIAGAFHYAKDFGNFDRNSKERSVSASSDRNIRDHLWRWSTYFGRNIPTEIRRSIFDKPVLCPY